MRRTILKAAPGYTTANLGPMAQVLSGGYFGPSGAGYAGPSNAQFGPGQPPPPHELGGDPRQFQYRPGWNLPTLPGEGRLIDYKTLRAVADIDFFVRKAIEVRKDQMGDLEIDIIARDRKDAKRARQTVDQQQDKIAEVMRWMELPDGRHNWNQWLRLIMEDHLVVDGIALNLRRNMDPDAGRVSVVTGQPMGKFLWLEGLDAATIKPLLGSDGRLPLPVGANGERQPAYQQFLFGIPVFDWTTEELIYAVKNARYQSPYGFSAVEYFLTLINLNLRYWSSMNAIYTDGTLPEGIVTAPEGWTPQQIAGFAENWNRALAGDPRALRKLHMAPHGVGWIAFKDHVFDKELARFLLDILALAMDLTPNELGFEPSGNKGMGGKGYSESQERVQERRSVGPTWRFLRDSILNPILWYEFGLTDLTFAVVDDEQIDEANRAQADDIDLRNGRISLDELVERDGGEPPGVGRIFVFGNQILGEPDLIKLTEEGAAALGLLQPKELDAKGMPVEPEPPAGTVPGQEGIAPGQEPQAPAPMDKGKGGDEPRAGEQAEKSASLMLDDLERWKAKALKAIKRGKPATVKFASALIPLDLANTICNRLEKAVTPDEVKAAFSDDALKAAVSERWNSLVLGELALRAA